MERSRAMIMPKPRIEQARVCGRPTKRLAYFGSRRWPICPRPAGEFAFFTPSIGAVFLPTLVAVAMLVIHARKTHNPTLQYAVIAFVLLLLTLLVTFAVNGHQR
jgi:hypothetical protein